MLNPPPPHKYLYYIILRESPYTLKSLLAKANMIIKSFSIVFFPQNTRFDILKMCDLLNEISDIYYYNGWWTISITDNIIFRFFLCKCRGVKDIRRSRINNTIPTSVRRLPVSSVIYDHRHLHFSGIIVKMKITFYIRYFSY